MKNILLTIFTITFLSYSTNAQTFNNSTFGNFSRISGGIAGTNINNSTGVETQVILGGVFEAEILQGSTVVGTATVTATNPIGFTNTFTATRTGTGLGTLAQAASNVFSDLDLPASGTWNLSFAAAAGFQIDGFSIFTDSVVLANPTFSGLTSSGIITAREGNLDFFSNASDGDIVTNGSNLTTNLGTSTSGILPAGNDFSIDVAGSDLSFVYSTAANDIGSIGTELFRYTIQASSTIPEPSSIVLFGLGALGLLFHRKR